VFSFAIKRSDASYNSICNLPELYVLLQINRHTCKLYIYIWKLRKRLMIINVEAYRWELNAVLVILTVIVFPNSIASPIKGASSCYYQASYGFKQEPFRGRIFTDISCCFQGPYNLNNFGTWAAARPSKHNLR
jgi:hypothetical protein